MTTSHYIPGEWISVIAGDCVAFLPPDTSADVIERLWDSMGDGEDLMSQLVIITDGRFSGLPAFAIARVEDSQAHVMLRGNVELNVARDGEEQRLFAPSVSTWLEQIVDDVTHLQFRPANANLTEVDVSYPLTAGVVFSAQLDLLTAADRKAQAQRPSRRIRKVTEEPEVRDDVPNSVEPLPEPVEALPEPVDALPEPVGSTTVHAPVPPPPASSGLWLDSDSVEDSQPQAGALDEDHDGMTVMNSEVVNLRQQLPAWEGDAVPGPLVDPADRTAVPKIVLSTGMAVALDRPVLLGRAPQVSRVKNDEMPRLITVESPNHDISRTHAEVRMDGQEIVVTDLDSTNGVLLTRPGAVAERLKPGQSTAVEAGAVVDLGEGVTFVVGRQA